jgi:hypothetical protein
MRQEESVGNRGNTEEMERGGSKSGRCQGPWKYVDAIM